jgi:hypothetical protein
MKYCNLFGEHKQLVIQPCSQALSSKLLAQTSPQSSVHAFDFRDVINMQKRAIGILRGLGTRLAIPKLMRGLGRVLKSAQIRKWTK